MAFSIKRASQIAELYLRSRRYDDVCAGDAAVVGEGDEEDGLATSSAMLISSSTHSLSSVRTFALLFWQLTTVYNSVNVSWAYMTSP